jgi:NADP-dependent 3-hydroxy acid dehydrogenase YdfG
VLIVGASSGIGREIAAQLVAAGACVAGAARRVERLESLPGVAGFYCDVRDPVQCEAVVAATCDHLGGLDALIYAAGLSRITPLHRAGIEDWQAVFETNVFGAALVTRAALPFLLASPNQGSAMLLSSDSSDLAYPGLVAYSASKAALSRFCQGLAAEVPELKVCEVVVGPTLGTEVSDDFDPVDFQEWAPRWFDGGFVRYEMQQPSDVAAAILAALLAESLPARLVAAGLAEPKLGAS